MFNFESLSVVRKTHKYHANGRKIIRIIIYILYIKRGGEGRRRSLGWREVAGKER